MEKEITVRDRKGEFTVPCFQYFGFCVLCMSVTMIHFIQAAEEVHLHKRVQEMKVYVSQKFCRDPFKTCFVLSELFVV